jgi:tellurium resistance protein TerD
MGLFDNLFTKKAEEPAQEATSQPTNSQPVGMLNLKKNDILDLTKTSAHYDSLRLSAGWDINKKGGSNYDLDLFALLLDSKDKLTSVTNSCVYYGNKKATGIELDKDNLTGEGDGDDENIFINLTKIPPAVNKIILAVAIYDADSRRQSFQYVNNAYVRLVDTSNKKEVEICRYNLSNDGGSSTAVICAELFRNGSDWSFKAVGDFTKGSISKIKNKYE